MIRFTLFQFPTSWMTVIQAMMKNIAQAKEYRERQEALKRTQKDLINSLWYAQSAIKDVESKRKRMEEKIQRENAEAKLVDRNNRREKLRQLMASENAAYKLELRSAGVVMQN
jgi:hypothetical protein